MSLKQIRKSRGMSQMTLAKRVGMGQSTISGYESGKRVPRIPDVVKLADALEVSPETIIKSLNIAERDDVSTANGISGKEE